MKQRLGMERVEGNKLAATTRVWARYDPNRLTHGVAHSWNILSKNPLGLRTNVNIRLTFHRRLTFALSGRRRRSALERVVRPHVATVSHSRLPPARTESAERAASAVPPPSMTHAEVADET